MARTSKIPRYKEFSEFRNTFVFYEDSKKQRYFTEGKPITLELGCGKAEPTLAFAEKYPDRNFIGVDVKADRLWRPAKTALEKGIPNAKFLKMHMRFLERAFDENSVEEIWLTFSDPYPKARQEKHRLTHPKFLELYKRVLRPGSKIHFKTDNIWLFDWSIAQFAQDADLEFEELTYNLHGDNDVNEDAKVLTYYEKKFMAEGESISYCQLSL